MKPKYEEYTTKHIVGILDTDEKGEKVIIVDGEEYNLNIFLEELNGQEIEIKSTYRQV